MGGRPRGVRAREPARRRRRRLRSLRPRSPPSPPRRRGGALAARPRGRRRGPPLDRHLAARSRRSSGSPRPGRLLVSGAAGRGSSPPTARSGGSATSRRRPGRRTGCRRRGDVDRARGDRAAQRGRCTGRSRGAKIAFPRWGGTRTDTRIAYLTTSRLHVVAGDGTRTIDADGRPRRGFAPAWQPGDRRATCSRTSTRRSRHRARPRPRHVRGCRVATRMRAYSPGRRTAARSRSRRADEVVLFAARYRARAAVRVADVQRCAFAPRRTARARARNGAARLLRARSAHAVRRAEPSRAASRGRRTAAGSSPRSRPPSNGSSCRHRRAPRPGRFAHCAPVRRAAVP